MEIEQSLTILFTSLHNNDSLKNNNELLFYQEETTMKLHSAFKKLFAMTFLFVQIVLPLHAAEYLRNYVCVVRTNMPESTVKFLNEYKDILEKKGYSDYASYISDYLKGTFGSGFAFYYNGVPYLITNRHVVSQAESVNAIFENEDGSTSEYKNLKIIAADEDVDIALIQLPASYARAGLELDTDKLSDGDEVWSAGYPALGEEPAWQLGKGNVTNATARVKELLDPDISSIIQHSAQVDSGNSGGPLLIKDDNARGGYKVVGINTWKASNRENTNFAIPANLVYSFVQTTISGTATNKDIKSRLNQFKEAIAEEDFLDTAKFISNDFVASYGGDNFVTVISKAPKTVQDLIVVVFVYDPIEGMREALAYTVWNNFQGKKGVLNYEVSKTEESDNQANVSFNINDKESTSVWQKEHGNYKLTEFSAVKRTSTSSKNSFTAAANGEPMGFSIEDPYFLDIKGGLLYTMDSKKSSFCLKASFNLSDIFATGIFLQYPKIALDTNAPDTLTKMSTFGLFARLQIPFRYNRFMVEPFGQLHFGFANFGDFDTGRTVFGWGLGVDAAYMLSSLIAPEISFSYQNNTYSDVNDKIKTGNLAFSVGLKLLAF